MLMRIKGITNGVVFPGFSTYVRPFRALFLNMQLVPRVHTPQSLPIALCRSYASLTFLLCC